MIDLVASPTTPGPDRLAGMVRYLGTGCNSGEEKSRQGLDLTLGSGSEHVWHEAPTEHLIGTAVSANGLRKAYTSRCGGRRDRLGVADDENPEPEGE
jgi:hypothetical protein